jgi:hypothetical protein
MSLSSSVLEIKVICFLRMLVAAYKPTEHHKPEDLNPCLNCCKPQSSWGSSVYCSMRLVDCFRYCHECMNKATGERNCIVCGKKVGKNLVMCDLCPRAYHTDCLQPPLTKVKQLKLDYMSSDGLPGTGALRPRHSWGLQSSHDLILWVSYIVKYFTTNYIHISCFYLRLLQCNTYFITTPIHHL